jgi:hypothetical protein
MNNCSPTADEKPDLIQAFIEANIQQLLQGQRKIHHCVRQLDDQQLWWRPREEMNSIANILLHLSGNLRQWLISGLTAAPDTRQRQMEFDDRSGRSGEQLLQLLHDTLAEACETMRRLSTGELLRVRRVQQFDVNACQTMADSVCHFCGHVQEIVHMTRLLKENQYIFYFVPDQP